MINKIIHELKLGKKFLTFSLFSMIGQGLAMVAPLVAAKLLSPEKFGSFSLVTMVIFLFVTLLISSFQTPFIVYANQEKKATGKINKSFTIQNVFFIFSLILFIILVFSFEQQFVNFTGLIQKGSIYSVIFAFLGISIKTFLNKLMLGLDRKVENSLVDLTYGLIFILVIIFLSFMKILSLELIFISYLATALMTLIFFAPRIDWKILMPFEFNTKQALEMLNHTKWIFVSGISIYLINWGDNIVLKIYSSLEKIGIYSFSYQIFKALIMTINLIGSYFLPGLSANINNSAKIRDYLKGKRVRLIIGGILAISFIYFGIPYLVHFAYGAKYMESINVVRVLMVGAFFHLYSIFYTPIFAALKKFRVYQTINMIQVAVNLGFDFLLIQRWGLLGLATATAIGYLLKLILVELYFGIKVKKALFANFTFNNSGDTNS